jgi:hypothetical protein
MSQCKPRITVIIRKKKEVKTKKEPHKKGEGVKEDFFLL